MASIESLLTLEASLARPVRRAFEDYARPVAVEIVKLAEDGRLAEAERAIGGLSFAPAIDGLHGRFRSHFLQALLLGANNVRGSVRATNLFHAGLPEETIELAATQFESVMLDSDDFLQRRVRQVLARETAPDEPGFVDPDAPLDSFTEVRKVADVGLAAAINASVMGTGGALVDVGANLTTSRLVSFGHLAEAQAAGVKRYQVTEILDSVTCAVCRGMHGKVFDVGPAHQRLLRELGMSGAELKATAKFPAPSKAGLRSLSKMSDGDLQSRGWNTPPYHPNCRGVLVPVGSVPRSEITGFRPIPDEPTVTSGPVVPSADELASVDFFASEALLAEADAGVNGTLAMFRSAAGEWTPRRRMLHESIISDLMKDARAVAADEVPQLQLLGGGTASGKSTVVKSGKVKLPPNSAVVDADAIKARLPEFQATIDAGNVGKKAGEFVATRAAALVHEESSYLAKEVARRAAAMRSNLVLDQVGDGSIESFAAKLKPFRDAGYRIKADYVSIDIQTAMERAIARGKKTGRFVPEDVLIELHAGVSRAFPAAVRRKLFDEASLYLNEGAEPRLIAEVVNGRLVIRDRALWREFKAKANVTPESFLPSKQLPSITVDDLIDDLDTTEVNRRVLSSMAVVNDEDIRDAIINAKRLLDESDLSVRASTSVFDDILRDGRFKSQFETGSSRGSYTPNGRAATERELFGYPRDLPVEQRPIYGYLRPRVLPEGAYDGASFYGDMRVVLSDAARARATFTSGDSLGGAFGAARLTSPGATGLTSGGRFGGTGSSLRQWARAEHVADGSRGAAQIGYVEAQIHGQLKVSDIKEILWPLDEDLPDFVLRWARDGKVPIRKATAGDLNPTDEFFYKP